VTVATSLSLIIMGQRCSCIEGEEVRRRGAFVDACNASDEDECEQYTQLENMQVQLDKQQQRLQQKQLLREVLDHLLEASFHDPPTGYQMEGKEEAEKNQQRDSASDEEDGDIGNTNSCHHHQHHTSCAAATIIQASWRRHNAKQQYNELIELIAWYVHVSKVIICQSVIRRKLATARYNNLLRIVKRREPVLYGAQEAPYHADAITNPISVTKLKDITMSTTSMPIFYDYEQEPPSPNDVTVLNDSLDKSPTSQAILSDETQVNEYIVEKTNPDGSKTITTMTVKTSKEIRTLRDGSQVTEDVSTTSSKTSKKKHIPLPSMTSSKDVKMDVNRPKLITVSSINQRVSNYHRAYLDALDTKILSSRRSCSMLVTDTSVPFAGNKNDVVRKVERIENRLASSLTNKMQSSRIIRLRSISDYSTEITDDDGYESLRSE
jgi:hypothetical protein